MKKKEVDSLPSVSCWEVKEEEEEERFDCWLVSRHLYLYFCFFFVVVGFFSVSLFSFVLILHRVPRLITLVAGAMESCYSNFNRSGRYYCPVASCKRACTVHVHMADYRAGAGQSWLKVHIILVYIFPITNASQNNYTSQYTHGHNVHIDNSFISIISCKYFTLKKSSRKRHSIQSFTHWA